MQIRYLLLFLLLIPVCAIAQYPDSAKHTTPNLHSLTFSSLYATGGNTSNNQVGYLDPITGKWNGLATAYQLWLTNQLYTLTTTHVSDTTTLKSYIGSATQLIVSDQRTGGIFNYVASGLTVNGGTVYSHSGGGYWQRLFSGAVQASWFGVKADGTTNDQPALQAAVNQVLSVGGQLELPLGNTRITSPIVFPQTGKKIELFGKSNISSVITADFTSVSKRAALSVDNPSSGTRSFVYFHDFALAGVNDANTDGIYCNYTASFSTLQRVFVQNFYDGIVIANDVYMKIYDCVSDFNLNNGASFGKDLSGANAVCNNNTIQGGLYNLNGNIGIYWYGTFGGAIMQTSTEDNTHSNITLEDVKGVSLNGIYQEYDKTLTPIQDQQIYINGCNGVTIDGVSIPAYDDNGRPVIKIIGSNAISLRGINIGFPSVTSLTNSIGILVRNSAAVGISESRIEYNSTGIQVDSVNKVTINNIKFNGNTNPVVVANSANATLYWKDAFNADYTASSIGASAIVNVEYIDGTQTGQTASTGDNSTKFATTAFVKNQGYLLPTSTFNLGTTSIAFNRSSASQSLTGISIDGNAGTVTNGVYTVGAQTIGGQKTFTSSIFTMGSAAIKSVTGTGFGYDPTTYPIVMIGSVSGNRAIALGVDPSTNTGGSFSGDGSEIVVPNLAKFLQPNSGNTDWINPLKINNGVISLPLLTASRPLFLGSSNNVTTTGPGTTSQLIDGTGSLQTIPNGISSFTVSTAGGTISPTYSSGTLTIPDYYYNAGSFTVPQTFLKANLGASTTASAILSNNQASTSGTTQQWSPALQHHGTAWNGTVSQTHDAIFYLKTINSGSGNSNSVLNIDFSLAGGSYVNQYSLDRSGNFTAQGSVTSSSLAASSITAASNVQSPVYKIQDNVSGNSVQISVPSLSANVPFKFPNALPSVTSNLTVDASGNMGYSTPGVFASRTTVSDVAYTALTTDYLIAYTSLTAARTVTLVALATRQVQIIKDEAGTAGSNNITVNAPGGKTIDGSASKTISTNYGSLKIYYNGTNFFTTP